MDFLHCALLVVVILFALYCGTRFFREGLSESMSSVSVGRYVKTRTRSPRPVARGGKTSGRGQRGAAGHRVTAHLQGSQNLPLSPWLRQQQPL